METSLEGMIEQPRSPTQQVWPLLEWDDTLVLLLVAVVTGYYFLINQKPKGLHLMYISPQIEAGLASKDGQKKTAETRNIVEELDQAVGPGSSAL
jgi:hypothetical protein